MKIGPVRGVGNRWAHVKINRIWGPTQYLRGVPYSVLFANPSDLELRPTENFLHLHLLENHREITQLITEFLQSRSTFRTTFSSSLLLDLHLLLHTTALFAILDVYEAVTTMEAPQALAISLHRAQAAFAIVGRAKRIAEACIRTPSKILTQTAQASIRTPRKILTRTARACIQTPRKILSQTARTCIQTPGKILTQTSAAINFVVAVTDILSGSPLNSIVPDTPNFITE